MHARGVSHPGIPPPATSHHSSARRDSDELGSLASSTSQLQAALAAACQGCGRSAPRRHSMSGPHAPQPLRCDPQRSACLGKRKSEDVQAPVGDWRAAFSSSFYSPAPFTVAAPGAGQPMQASPFASGSASMPPLPATPARAASPAAPPSQLGAAPTLSGTACLSAQDWDDVIPNEWLSGFPCASLDLTASYPARTQSARPRLHY